MELRIYSIRDAKAEIFNQPIFQKTHGEAERNFQTLVNDEKSTVFKYPEDFDLYYVGSYDDNTGLIKPLDTPQHIVKAIALKSLDEAGGTNAFLDVISTTDRKLQNLFKKEAQNESSTKKSSNLRFNSPSGLRCYLRSNRWFIYQL